jgi:hypothetical protein
MSSCTVIGSFNPTTVSNTASKSVGVCTMVGPSAFQSNHASSAVTGRLHPTLGYHAGGACQVGRVGRCAPESTNS